jgi:hypothetical protein
MPNPTIVPITQPRVPFLNPETGFVSMPWYLFLLSLSQSQGGSSVSLDDVQKGPPSLTVDEINAIIDKAAGDPTPSQDGLLAQIAELQKQVEALAVQPQFDYGVITAAINSLSSAPVTKTADFAVADGEAWLINNKSGSSCTVTLPTPSASIGRVLHFQNYQAQTLVSASSNVVPLAGGSAGTAILQAVAGANATLVSDGTSWIMTQYDSNNSLELE